MYRQVFGYATTVFGFWWLVSAGWGVTQEGVDLGEALRASLHIIIMCMIAAVLGVAAVVAWVILDKQAKREILGARGVRGLKCSIGDVPLNALAPVRAPELPNFEGMHDVPPTFFPLWIQHYQKSHPAHANLVIAMLKIYEHNKALPATHVKGGHGGRTLLNHSLLVAYQMQNLAMKWSYTGLRDRTGKRVLLKLRDGSYQFDPMDPLVMIVGLAHDIGKIEAFIFEGTEIVGSHHEHDLTGARMLARMPEMWDIPDADRIALLLSIAHYHHPMELPLSPDRRAIDDRTIAVMELLIKADFVASAIERKGVVPSEADYDKEMDDRQNTELTDEVIWQAFTEILEETGRINSTDLNYNIGTICQVIGQDSMRLVMQEAAIRGALVRRLGIAEPVKLGDGRYQITVKLLALLDAHKLLVKQVQGIAYPAESALWTVGFFGKKAAKGSKEASRLTGWAASIIIQTSVSKHVADLPSYGWVARVERGTMGTARAQGSDAVASETEAPAGLGAEQAEVTQPIPETEPLIAAAEAASQGASNEAQIVVDFDDPTAGADPEEDDDPDVVEYGQTLPETQRRPTGSNARAQKAKRTNKMMTDLDAAADLIVLPAALMRGPKAKPGKPTSLPRNEQAFKPETPEQASQDTLSVGQFIVPVAAQRPVQAPLVSPYNLKHAIATVLQFEPLSISVTGGGSHIYVVSRLHLHKHIPEFDWSKASSDIVALCKGTRGGGIEAMESGGELYLLADALVMKEFMAREKIVPLAQTEFVSTATV